MFFSIVVAVVVVGGGGSGSGICPNKTWYTMYALISLSLRLFQQTNNKQRKKTLRLCIHKEILISFCTKSNWKWAPPPTPSKLSKIANTYAYCATVQARFWNAQAHYLFCWIILTFLKHNFLPIQHTLSSSLPLFSFVLFVYVFFGVFCVCDKLQNISFFRNVANWIWAMNIILSSFVYDLRWMQMMWHTNWNEGDVNVNRHHFSCFFSIFLLLLLLLLSPPDGGFGMRVSSMWPMQMDRNQLPVKYLYMNRA